MIFENHGRQSLSEQNDRVESGVVQFAGDWPGLFIRGDDCMAIGQALGNLMKWLDFYASDGLLRNMQQTVGVIGELRMALDLVMVHSADQTPG